MKHREFIYWLQGYFELSGAQLFTSKQINIVRAHIAVSEKVMKKKSPFQSWLEGVFDCRGSEESDLHPEAVSAIKKKLSRMFKKDIDPSYPGDQDALNQLHGGSKPPTGQAYHC